MAGPAWEGEGEGEGPLQKVRSLSDMVLGFFDEQQMEMVVCDRHTEEYGSDDDEEVDGSDEEVDGSAEERRAFWESQHQLLQAALSRSSSLETRVRRETEAALRQLRSEGGLCSCSRNAARGCRECLRKGVSDRLRSAGYNSALCKSKWRSSVDIPSGEHTYIDVVVDAAGNKKKAADARVVVELSFRSEFEVARASEDYNALLRRLPEVFVGRPERLRSVLKVVCAAAKRCMRENRMHMGPWRKHKYMQAKWLTPCERVASEAAPSPPQAVAGGSPCQQHRPRASMLTFDLLGMLPVLHSAAVEAV